MTDADYSQLSQKLFGQQLTDNQLLVTACTHRSYLNEHRSSAKEHNERLEFLGDAVLELVVTEYLYHNYQEPEGILTNWRAALVKTESLLAVGHKLAIGPYLRLSQGEKQGNDRAFDQILANTIEALIGAVYLDQGYQAAKKFISNQILVTLPDILTSGRWIDVKTHLQEQVQSQEGQTPVYRLLEASGPDHDRSFRVGVYVGDSLRGQGDGPNKQLAQKAAAQAALEKMNPVRPA